MANDDKELLYAISYNQNAELSVTGAYLIDPHYLNRVAGTLQAEDFMNPLCAKLYTAATKAFREGKVLDPVMARDVILHATPNPDAFLVDCMNMCPSVSAAEDHAEYIHAQAKERRLRSRIDEALTSQSGDGLAVEIAGICQDYISGKLGRSHTMAQTLNKLMDSLSAPPANRVETGFTRVDALLKGMRAGNLVIVAARPAAGKSIWAQCVAMNVARTGKSVLLYSLEMSDEELGERIISGASGVQLDRITDHDLDEQAWKQLSDACQYLYDLPLIINDDPGVTTSKIRAEARTTKNLGLIIIDFMTLMKSEAKYDSRNLEVGAISRELKLLAMELNIPIIVISQLNRSVSDTDRPTLAALRDSGELEQNANKVIFLWNIDVEQGIKGVAVAKNRQGRCGAVQMRFVGDQMRFVEMRADEEVWSKTTPPRRRGKWEDDD
jgi:replicative DNA helicase